MAEQKLAARSLAVLRERGPHAAAELTVNFVLPFLIYICLDQRLGEVRALLASTVPPILWTVFQLARHRRVDALSMLVLTGILLSLLAMIGSGSVRFLQLREKLVTVIIGLIFIGSVMIGRPLIFELSRANMLRKSKEEAAKFAALLAQPNFRRTVTIMTLVVGAGLIADAAISAVLVFVLTIPQYLIVGPILGYASIGGLAVWVFWYGHRARRRSPPPPFVEGGSVDAPADPPRKPAGTHCSV